MTEQKSCPICRMADGFHDRPHFDVPAEFFKEKDWHKKSDPKPGDLMEIMLSPEPGKGHNRFAPDWSE